MIEIYGTQPMMSRRSAQMAGLSTALLVFAASAQVHAADTHIASSSCMLTDADKAANAKLSFDDFDQKGSSPSTWRRLIGRDCEIAAVESAEDYLVHAKFTDPHEQKDVIFHIAQSLAMLGRNQEASLMVAAAKDPLPVASNTFDWNTYLDGTWYFLQHDKSGLERSIKKLGDEGGPGNKINAGALSGLLNCFHKPYAVAYDSACRASPSTRTSP